MTIIDEGRTGPVVAKLFEVAHRGLRPVPPRRGPALRPQREPAYRPRTRDECRPFDPADLAGQSLSTPKTCKQVDDESRERRQAALIREAQLARERLESGLYQLPSASTKNK